MKQNAIINRAVLTGSATLLGMVSGAFAGDPAPYVPAPTPEPLCGSPGWTLEAAVLYMKPHQSEGEIADSDWDAGYRLGLAYEMPDGLRFALRVFGFDGTGEYGEGRYGEGRYRNNDVEEEFFALDFLVGDTFCPSEDLSIAINVGLRYASYKEDWKYYSDGKAADFDGFGPVIGTEIVRQLGGNWALYAELQASIIFGDNDVDDEGDSGDDSTMIISEIGGGVQYSFGSGHVRLGAEGQYWSGLSDSDTEDVSLLGAVLELGWRF